MSAADASMNAALHALEAALKRAAARHRAGWVSVSVPGAATWLMPMLRLALSGPHVLWRNRRDDLRLGVGCLLQDDTPAPKQEPSTQQIAERLDAFHLAPLEAATPALRPHALGALGFAWGGAGHAPACLRLPRLQLTRAEGQWWLSARARTGDAASLGLSLNGLRALAAPQQAWRTPTERGQGTERTQPMENSSWPLWQGQVAQAQRWIRRGKLDKVVLARAAVVPLEGFAARVRALSAVASAPQPLFAYAVGDAQSSLIGASPERLVAKTGSRVESEAVAGTAAASEGAALQHSAKDAREHAWVVAHLRAVLSQHCRSLEHAPSPSIWPLPGLLHLRTPFVGELSRPQHILTLVQALHPTPAVAGHPVAAALDAIETLETETRDIYAGPVGGFDAAGDGEFAVALRAAHFRANAAHLWAGAGLVRASDAAQEYAETALKLQAIAAQLALPQDALDPPTGQAPLCTSLSA